MVQGIVSPSKQPTQPVKPARRSIIALTPPISSLLSRNRRVRGKATGAQFGEDDDDEEEEEREEGGKEEVVTPISSPAKPAPAPVQPMSVAPATAKMPQPMKKRKLGKATGVQFDSDD